MVGGKKTRGARGAVAPYAGANEVTNIEMSDMDIRELDDDHDAGKEDKRMTLDDINFADDAESPSTVDEAKNASNTNKGTFLETEHSYRNNYEEDECMRPSRGRGMGRVEKGGRYAAQ